MKSIRYTAIQKAMDPSVKTFGIILGTLGRQGNPAILGHVRALLKRHNKRCFVLLLSEIFPKKLDIFSHVDAWVQIACPRLSVDWVSLLIVRISLGFFLSLARTHNRTTLFFFICT
jgi:2-(3-amino-3-carboxypropyl)histidine synthase